MTQIISITLKWISLWNENDIKYNKVNINSYCIATDTTCPYMNTEGTQHYDAVVKIVTLLLLY